MSEFTLLQGDSEKVLKGFSENIFDSVVCDPPYGLKFMSKKWDYDVPSVGLWKEVLRVLKPGGHAIIFGGSRTYHRLAVNVEDAGFEIRDQLMWLYGAGFPKGKSQLKPAHEPIVLARKAFKGSMKGNVAKHGTGSLNIDGCRVPTHDTWDAQGKSSGGDSINCLGDGLNNSGKSGRNALGRWPANVIHNGSEAVEEIFPGDGKKSSSRYFYCAKASKKDRNEGLENLEDKVGGGIGGTVDGSLLTGSGNVRNNKMKNNHPTVKPTALMRYLCKLVTPAGSLILDPFMGSGSTGKAAVLEGFKFCGIELNSDYLEIARVRIQHAQEGLNE